MKKLFILLIIFALFPAYYFTGKNKLNSGEIPLKWVANLAGDFSFKDNWSYSEGIFVNKFGQLSCDGLCPPEIYEMKDENGKIYEDSLTSFYKFVDTTHIFHSIKSDACTYEWAGANFITAERINNDTLICYTQNNAATHSSLHLIITKNAVKPTIILNGIISENGEKIYHCKSGKMLIDSTLWNKGVLKASFDFEFDNNEKMYWKGNIYAKISIN